MCACGVTHKKQTFCGHPCYCARGKCRSCYIKELRTPTKRREYNLKATRKVTHKEYEVLFEVQGRKCAICERTSDPQRPHMSIDHDHKTEAIRGILCTPCNLMIGCAQDDPARLRAAAEYLEIKR